MEQVEILFFDLDENSFVEPDEEQFDKDNPDWNPYESLSNIRNSIIETLLVNGTPKRFIEAIYEEDANRITFKFQDVHESIYKKY